MSLILDALKKAEQDRHAGQAPALDELLARPPTARAIVRPRGHAQAVLAATAVASTLFAAVGIAWWLWPDDPPPVAAAEVPTPPQAAAAAPAASPAPPLRVDPERLVAPVADFPEDAVGTGDTGAREALTLEDLDSETPPPAAEPISPPAPREPALAAVPAPAELPPPAPAPEPGAKPLKEMPPAFRSEFPKLTVDVHVYDPNPLRRFVLINGKKYRETDTLLDGPRILEITPLGVIVEHRNSRVLLELPR